MFSCKVTLIDIDIFISGLLFLHYLLLFIFSSLENELFPSFIHHVSHRLHHRELALLWLLIILKVTALSSKVSKHWDMDITYGVPLKWQGNTSQIFSIVQTDYDVDGTFSMCTFYSAGLGSGSVSSGPSCPPSSIIFLYLLLKNPTWEYKNKSMLNK